MNWYLKVLRQYIDFEGRARRKEYWMFVLINIVVAFIVSLLDNILGLADKETGTGVLSTLYALAVLLPGIAVSVRRLHDINKSGWWLLISFIPLIGIIWLLVLMATDGKPGQNQYGINPKEVTETQTM
ncbi:MAG: DUF805 domain-containing protein [Cryomorphaceae bacterium]|nr:DUF805 domain-containing protein [Cryomorphaceae bacterium]